MLLKRKIDLSVKFLCKVCLGIMLKIVNFFKDFLLYKKGDILY